MNYSRKIDLCKLLFVTLLTIAGHISQAQIKVMSYNIHYAVGMDGKNSIEGIASVIKRLDPDIVGLQEIGDSAMAYKLGALTGMKAVFGPSLDKMTGYGDAVLSKHPFEWEGNYSIPSASSSRYQAMSVIVDVSAKLPGKGKVRFINTHFDWLKTIGSQYARLATVDLIEEAFFKNKSLPKIPAILTGDLNVTPEDAVITKLKKYGWYNCSEGNIYNTISSVTPRKQIDYIHCRPRDQWKVTSFKVITGELSSDHLPIVAELTIR